MSHPTTTVKSIADPLVKFELFKVKPRWMFLRLETESGLVGWGEPYLEGFADTVASAVMELMEMIMKIEKVTMSTPPVLPPLPGAADIPDRNNELSLARHSAFKNKVFHGTSIIDPAQISLIWQRFYRSNFYAQGCPIIMSAMSGIDQALWDLAGKRQGVNVTELFGGAVRNKLKMYCWCGGEGDNTPEDAAASAKKVIETTNYKNIKMNAIGPVNYIDYVEKSSVLGEAGSIEKAVKRLKAVREAVGPSVGIGLDFHGRVRGAVVKQLMKALEPFDPLFFEEPTQPSQHARYAGNPSAGPYHNTPVPIATGERMYTLEQFQELFKQNWVNIVQPDCSHCGGITQLLAIAKMAEAHEVGFAPHCPSGPICFAASLAVDANALTFVLQESSLGIHYNKMNGADLTDYVLNKEDFNVDEDGYLKPFTRPGLGVIIDEERVRAAADEGHNWRELQFTLEDGTPATW